MLTTDSASGALSIIQSHQLNGIVLTSDIAVAEAGGETALLMKTVRGKIPTVTLITPSTWKRPDVRWVFDTVYDPPLHEYIHMPIGVDELFIVLKRVGVTKDKEETTSNVSRQSSA